MKVKRIIGNISAPDPSAVDELYQCVLALDLAMDHGWILTYAGSAKMTVQVSFASQGGSSTPVPDFSIEVDDLDEALRRVQKSQIPWSMTRSVSRGVFAGSMLETHSEGLPTFFSTSGRVRPNNSFKPTPLRGAV